MLTIYTLAKDIRYFGLENFKKMYMRNAHKPHDKTNGTLKSYSKNL